MKKHSLIFLFIIFFASITAQNTTKYFRRFYIDPRQNQLRTEVPISAEKARYTNAYRVLYNENGQIIDVRYVVRGIQYYDDSNFTGMTISYTDSTEKRKFVNSKNILVKNRGVYSNVLYFDKQNRPLKLINYDNKGLIAQDINSVAIYSWILNEKGWIISEKYMDGNKNQVWNKRGFFEEKFNWGEDSLNYIIRFEYYDDKGNLTRNNNGISVRTAKFDKKTESTQEIKNYDKKHQLVISDEGFAISTFQYDKDLNMTSRFFFDTKNNLTKNSNDVAIIEWEYDSLGNNSELTYYDNNMKLTPYKLNNISRIVRKYDTYGRPTEVRTFDNKNNLLENKKREAILRWFYDEKGKVKSVKGYNSKDQWVSERYNSSEMP